MNLRRELTVANYDFWLDNYGVGGKDRKALRRELSANLADATREHGWKDARARLGSVRALAKGHAEAVGKPGGLCWREAFLALIGAAMALFIVGMWSAWMFMEGVQATGGSAGREVTGKPFLLPGTELSATTGDHFALGFNWGPAWSWLPLAAFLIALRPWRLRFRR